ncbi:phage integrase family protein [mine drainage metagenome]|uniref:Phage integrase family protein n=1 Tax=mine drainage metagenome TaxID=410659 RepID=T0Z6E4_9ZZZZ
MTSTRVTAKTLAADAAEFLRFKRAMGMRYWRAEFVLNSFVRFVHDQWGERSAPLDEAVTRWAARIEDRKAITVGNEFGVVRQLCLFRRRSDPRSFVPEHAVAPIKESVFLPYIFTHNEVLALLDAATSHEGRSIWGAMLRAVVLVLYCTGMRLGEATRLRMDDVDLRRAILTVQRSKGRTRMLAIRADLVAELQQYLRHRTTVLADTGTTDPGTLFIRIDGSALPMRAASEALRKLLRELGLKPLHGRAGARPYELRHAFAVHRLTAWAVEGVDVHAKLPWLSAYLGHLNVLGTEVYLKATPQLLELASQRFEQRAHGRRKLR